VTANKGDDDYLMMMHMKAWLLLLVMKSRITDSRISNCVTCIVHCVFCLCMILSQCSTA
jgi:hypothetical protein